MHSLWSITVTKVSIIVQSLELNLSRLGINPVTNLVAACSSLGDVKDDSLLFTDPETPEFLHRDNLLFTKSSEHHREEVEGDGVRVGEGERE
jgi:hypothetical protein